jgi:nanoRNase/pAp phosphatase (c-di-AMP/oligoRNAs hydrolase)
MIVDLLRSLTNKKRILILTHNNPDPDAMSAAFAMKHLIFKMVRKKATIAYMGIVGRLENRELVKQCKIDMKQSFGLNFARFDYIIVVDTQPQAGNVFIPEGVQVNAVIDHHITKRKLVRRKDLIVDIRPKYGSTCTIVAEYYKELNIVPETDIATAMCFGVITDSIGTGRDSAPEDQNMLGFLYPHISINKLVKIQNPPLPRYHFKTLRKAIENSVILDDVLFCDLGDVRNADLIAESADYMVRMRDIKCIFVIGKLENIALFSLRTKSNKRSVGNIAMAIVKGIGYGGGHTKFAGGQVPITTRSYSEAVNILKTRFLKALGIAANVEEKQI